jgi:hypothetical protein
MTIALQSISPVTWDQQAWENAIEAEREKLVASQSPGERARLEYYHHLLERDMSVEALWDELNTRRGGEATQSTVDALLYQLREGGIAQLKTPTCQRRLAELSASQLRKVVAALVRLQSRYPKITDDLLSALDDMVRSDDDRRRP